ncbi:Gfo/Idh/MocA family oxidoreductase [Flavihumibacter sp. CACIAM 22H1]|uniref:Gfo/Idh/MocA family protein n=1 Tax=Flavihumibacter sp. CACIAM 22H1 TaxID=1812911 RepID=UPI0007A8AA61|nr:Gfo/Idh/MocA family oxidoreductase [Flavihumibacter sp. CACIAM 22H1]KYP13245.1 MAG: hypothetical protein A1D16_06615 [Flavihumibacter sp. CACIAM 22H1]
MHYRFALLGCGHIGKKHAALAARYGSLVAVGDLLPEKARVLADSWNVPAYTNLTDMLLETNPDIVLICSPNGLHARHAIEALQAGCHVLCEKPMALRVQDAEAMIQTAKSFNKRLFIVKQNRFNPPVEWVKQQLEAKRFGKLLGFQLNAFWNRTTAYFTESAWKGSLELDGGPLFTQFSHFVDLLYWYLGELKTVHFAQSENLLHENSIEFEDQGIAILEFMSGIRGSIHYSINAFDHNMEGSLSLFGEKGTVKIGGTYLNKLEYLALPGAERPDLPESPVNEYQGYTGSSSHHHLVYEAMLRSLSDPAYPFIKPEEARHSVQIIEAIYAQMGNRNRYYE